MQIINDIDRPDVNGEEPKMKEVADIIRGSLLKYNIPFLSVTTDDNLTSSVTIKGSYTPKEEWANGIFHNSKYFIINISPKNKRYYNSGDKVEMELYSSDSGVENMRRGTSDIPKTVKKLQNWGLKNLNKNL